MKIIKYTNFLLEANLETREISDMPSYLENMSLGLSDKLYFLGKVDLDILVDFGCADGVLLNYISRVDKKTRLIGYDLSLKMVNHAKNKFPHIQFESKWDIIEKILEENKDLKIGILLSSVIHEVYSYSKSSSINYFWKQQVFNSNIDYVIIRDMVPSSSYDRMNIREIKKIKEKSNPKQLTEFEEQWGDIGTDFRTLLHWLLKYRYIINWGRELYENYLPVSIEHLKNRWIPNTWNIEFEEHYLLDYIKKTIKRDFDIDLNEASHLKMILKNKNK